jgi:hypothetical protein
MGKLGVDGRRNHATHAVADAQVRTYVTAQACAARNQSNEAWFNSASIAASCGSWRKASNYCPQLANRRMPGGVTSAAICLFGVAVAIIGASISFVLFSIFATKAERLGRTTLCAHERPAH